MFQDIALDNTDLRTLSRPLTPEMAAIAQYEPGIFKIERGLICHNSPTNFIGALLVALNKPVNERLLRNSGVNIPHRIQQPFDLLENVPLTYYDEAAEDYKPTGQVAEQVLYKGICGLDVGVVISGPLSGLILDTQDGTNPLDALCINRVWNDSIASQKDLPYKPIVEITQPDVAITPRAKKLQHYPNLSSVDLMYLNWGIADRNRQLFKAKLQNLQGQAGQMYTSEMFFKLCQENGISVDENNFHLTRTIPGREALEKQLFKIF